MIHSVRLHVGTFRSGGIEALNDFIASTVREGGRAFIPNHNLHSLRLAQGMDDFRQIFDDAEIVAVDGMPVIWFAMATGSTIRPEDRATFLDWMPALWDIAEAEQWRVFLLGGDADVNAEARGVLSEQYPAATFLGRDGYFERTPEGNDAVLAEIAQARPHILLVGLGMPAQERWISEHLEHLEANVVLPCGGYLDYLCDDRLTPPRWLGRIGMEWLYRLFRQPRRLFGRYLIEPWPVFFQFGRFWVADRVARRSSEPDSAA